MRQRREMKWGGWIALGLLTLAAGCASERVRFVSIASPPSALTPREAQTVEVYEVDLPDRGYVEVGDLELKRSLDDAMNASREQAVRTLRIKAASIGCDGIILLPDTTSEPTEGVTLDDDLTQSELDTLRARCILFEDPDAEAQPPR